MRYSEYRETYKELFHNFKNNDMSFGFFKNANMELKLKFLSAHSFKVRIYYSDFYEEFFASVSDISYEGRGKTVYAAFISLFDIIINEFFFDEVKEVVNLEEGLL